MRSRYGKKRLCAALLALLMLLCAGASAGARSVSDLETDITEQEQKEAEARAEAAYYQGLYDELQTQLQEANAEIEALFDEMLELGRQIADAEAEVERYALQQEENEKTLAEQKETMAKRIQYMYEQQSSSFWEVLTGARSLAEVMNSADYIRSLSEYDSKMMDSYKATLAETERLKEESIAKKDEILLLRDDLMVKQSDMADRAQDIVDRMNGFQAKISESNAAAEAYAAEAAQKKSELEALKLQIRRAAEEAARKKAEEEARRKAEAEAAARAAEEARRKAEEDAAAAAAAAAEAGSGSSGNSGNQPADLRWALNDTRGVGSISIDPYAMNPTGHTNLELLASILECECGSQPYNAQVAVANVIFNRIQSPRWQTTMYDVIMGRGQFTPVDNGTLAISLAKGARQTCVNIARDCFNGARALDTRWMYFCDFNDWRNNPRHYTEYQILGAHIFYY